MKQSASGESADLANERFNIIPAALEHVTACSNAFALLLDEIEDLPGNNLQNTAHNVDLFRTVVRESIIAGYPPVIALHEDDPIGFFLCVKILGFDFNKNIIQAFGSYVYPKYRSLGLSKKMCDFGFSFYKQNGVKEIYSGKILQNNKSPEVILKLGLTKIEILCKTL